MSRKRWFFHVVTRSLAHRKGGTLLLLLVLTMASSLVTALGIVSFSMEKKIAEEIRRYGANLVVVGDSAGMEVGSGGMNFGMIAEPAYVAQGQVEQAYCRIVPYGRTIPQACGELSILKAEMLLRMALSFQRYAGSSPGGG